MKKQRFNLNLIDILLKLNIVVYENQKQDQKHKLQLNFDRLISYIVMYITIESKRVIEKQLIDQTLKT